VNAHCPRCQKLLESAQVDTIQVRLCQACRGVLLAHADLIQILEVSWRAISEGQAEATNFHAPENWKKELTLHCPDCQATMEKYGYMGIAAVQIDRCDPCGLVWLDTDELQNMVLALARDNYRSARALKKERAETLDLMQGSVPPVGRAGGIWLFPSCESGPEQVAVVALQLLRLLLR
jgi:Zn-finger nucleic acid-binding protein